MKRWLIFLFALPLAAQSTSTWLDPTRALNNWSSAGFSIPAYSTNCATQPSLTTGSGAASANATAIHNALASCDSTHNVVNIPAGTYYSTAIIYGTQGKQVLRGAGASSTYLYLSGGTSGPGGQSTGILMVSSSPIYNGNPAVLPPSGSQQCLWTGGYSQGATTITLSSCGGTPPLNQTIILDQANDTSDTSGIYICDTNISNCGYEGSSGGNNDGRFISGVTHSQQQVVYVTAVSGSGSGPYTVTITPGVAFTNVRSGQSPGAWWPGFVQEDGLENMTIDGTSIAGVNVGWYNCYQCWVKGVRSIDADRAHVFVYQSGNDVVRDSYFYQSQSHYSESYVVEFEEASSVLVENNIFQQVTNPIMSGQHSGSVIDYNFAVDNIYSGGAGFMAGSYAVHNAGNEFNLWEGNDLNGIWADDAWGASDQQTYFRNSLPGWQTGLTSSTFPVLMRANVRAFNLIGNVLGQPSYHTQYQTYATSTSGGTGGANENKSIYSLGWAYTGPACSGGAMTTCDPLTYSTLMRWGNYDTVNAAAQWNATEASPGAVTYISANFTSSYFSGLVHTLTNSFIYASEPTWFGSVPWPPIGPDVTGGNVGICSGGTYAGAQATSSSQCTGGSLSTAWGGHVNAIPAQQCYLSVMGGPPDGSGSVLSFNANSCYSATPPPTTPGAPSLLLTIP